MKKILTILIILISFGLFAQGIKAVASGGKIKGYGVPRDGLVGYWTMDEDDSDGTTIFDRSGGGNDGTSANTPVFVADQNGKVGGAISFDGVDDYITIFNDSTQTNKSVSFWMKTNSPNRMSMLSGFLGAETIFVSNGILGTGLSSVNNTADGSDIDDGEWHHIVVNSNSGYEFFIDGLEYSLGNSGSWRASENIEIARTTMVFSSSLYFNGYISGITTYPSALTQTEVTQLYNSGLVSGKIKAVE